jgi:hypothetical protein
MLMTMTMTHAGDLESAIAAERESIEAGIAGGTLLTVSSEKTSDGGRRRAAAHGVQR